MITKQEIQPVITKKVVITDSLFASYVNAIAEHLLPYQWKVLNDQIPGAEKSHCIDNFRIAAGEMEGTHQGAVFQDTDLYKWLETVAFCIANGTGREYIEIADEAIALIGRARSPTDILIPILQSAVQIRNGRIWWKDMSYTAAAI